MGTEGFPPGVKLTTHLHLVPKWRMRSSITPLPHTPSRRGTYLSIGITLHFTFYLTRLSSWYPATLSAARNDGVIQAQSLLNLQNVLSDTEPNKYIQLLIQQLLIGTSGGGQNGGRHQSPWLSITKDKHIDRSSITITVEALSVPQLHQNELNVTVKETHRDK